VFQAQNSCCHLRIKSGLFLRGLWFKTGLSESVVSLSKSRRYANVGKWKGDPNSHKIGEETCTIPISLYSRPLKNPAIFTILKKTMDFFEVTGGRALSFPPWIRCWKDQPGSLGTEKKPIVFRSRGVMQRSLFMSYFPDPGAEIQVRDYRVKWEYDLFFSTFWSRIMHGVALIDRI